MTRVLHSFDRLGLTPEHISHAREIAEAHGNTSAGLEKALYTLSSLDNSVPRQVVELLRQKLAIARRKEERQCQMHWRPMR